MNFENLTRLNEKYINLTTVRRWFDTESGDGLVFLGFFQCRKVLLYSFVINTEKLVCTGSHVNIVGIIEMSVKVDRKQ